MYTYVCLVCGQKVLDYDGAPVRIRRADDSFLYYMHARCLERVKAARQCTYRKTVFRWTADELVVEGNFRGRPLQRAVETEAVRTYLENLGLLRLAAEAGRPTEERLREHGHLYDDDPDLLR